MKNKTLKSITTIFAAIVLSLACLSGCSGSPTAGGVSDLSQGGVLVLSVNPEISVSYDNDGNVTAIRGLNRDGNTILTEYTDYEGRPCREVVTELVGLIGEAGYFVEEIEGERRQITIEIEEGSSLPYDAFFDDVVDDVRECVTNHKWESPIDVRSDDDRYDDIDDRYDIDDVYDDVYDDLDDRYDDVYDDLDDRYDDDWDDVYDDDYYDDDWDDVYDDDYYDDDWDDDWDDDDDYYDVYDDVYDDDYYDDDWDDVYDDDYYDDDWDDVYDDDYYDDDWDDRYDDGYYDDDWDDDDDDDDWDDDWDDDDDDDWDDDWDD